MKLKLHLLCMFSVDRKFAMSKANSAPQLWKYQSDHAKKPTILSETICNDALHYRSKLQPLWLKQTPFRTVSLDFQYGPTRSRLIPWFKGGNTEKKSWMNVDICRYTWTNQLSSTVGLTYSSFESPIRTSGHNAQAMQIFEIGGPRAI
jgi:hypothetical protein